MSQSRTREGAWHELFLSVRLHMDISPALLSPRYSTELQLTLMIAVMNIAYFGWTQVVVSVWVHCCIHAYTLLHTIEPAAPGVPEPWDHAKKAFLLGKDQLSP